MTAFISNPVGHLLNALRGVWCPPPAEDWISEVRFDISDLSNSMRRNAVIKTQRYLLGHRKISRLSESRMRQCHYMLHIRLRCRPCCLRRSHLDFWRGELRAKNIIEAVREDNLNPIVGDGAKVQAQPIIQEETGVGALHWSFTSSLLSMKRSLQ